MAMKDEKMNMNSFRVPNSWLKRLKIVKIAKHREISSFFSYLKFEKIAKNREIGSLFSGQKLVIVVKNRVHSFRVIKYDGNSEEHPVHSTLQLCFLESLYIITVKPCLNTGITATKALALFT